MLLGLNLALPLLVLAVALAQDRLGNSPPNWSARRRINWRRALLGCMLLATALTVTITWQKDVQAVAEQDRIATEAKQREEKARTERKRISVEIKQVASLVGSLEPGLTDQEALTEIGREIRRLREQTSELEADLDGLRRYRNVAGLNIFGLTGKYGAGLKESSPLSRALEGAYAETGDGPEKTYTPVCDVEVVARLEQVISRFPNFPFARWAIAVCLRKAGDPLWRTHAERAMAILVHTTRITGHHSDHDALQTQVTRLLRTQ